MRIIWNILFFTIKVNAYTVAVVGAHGGLGRELVSQSLQKCHNVHAIVRRNSPIFKPSRKGWLSEDQTIRVPIVDKKLHIFTNFSESSYDSIIFCLSGAPFQKDDSYKIVNDICNNLPKKCKKICLVSAYGVGDSLKSANIGIQAMSAWYLKDVYTSKQIQENIICGISGKVETMILRPKVLSYDTIPFNPISTTRQDLARQILEWIDPH